MSRAHRDPSFGDPAEFRRGRHWHHEFLELLIRQAAFELDSRAFPNVSPFRLRTMIAAVPLVDVVVALTNTFRNYPHRRFV